MRLSVIPVSDSQHHLAVSNRVDLVHALIHAPVVELGKQLAKHVHHGLRLDATGLSSESG